MNTVAERLQTATANLTPPFAVVDLEALDSNAESMITRTNGLPIRLATKSLRCRTIVDRALRRAALRQAQAGLDAMAAENDHVAHRSPVGYIAVHDYFKIDHRRYFAAFESIVAKHQGRPHWGKLHTLKAEQLRSLYPRFHHFLQIRDRLDPGRTFAIAYLRGVLGHDGP